MIKHFLCAIVIIAITTTSSFGQTTKQKLDQLKNDPKTMANAAKADAGLIDKKNIIDSNLIKNAPIKRKEQGCRSRKDKSARSSS